MPDSQNGTDFTLLLSYNTKYKLLLSCNTHFALVLSRDEIGFGLNLGSDLSWKIHVTTPHPSNFGQLGYV